MDCSFSFKNYEKNGIEAFVNFYDLKSGDKFYIYDTFTSKFINKITKVKDGIFSHSPMLFVLEDPYPEGFAKNKYLELKVSSHEGDIRPDQMQDRICRGIILSFLRDMTLIDDDFIRESQVQYIIMRPDKVDSNTLKNNTYIEYKDETEITNKESIKDIIRTVCQLYRIYPGRSFYIFDKKSKSYFSKITPTQIEIPVQFTYIDDTIKYGDMNFDSYVYNVFNSIYEDLVIKHITPDNYDLFRINKLKQSEEDISAKSIPEIDTDFAKISSILKEHNIRCKDGIYHSFYLMVSDNNLKDNNIRKFFNVIAKRDGNSFTLIEFTYDDGGLTAINANFPCMDMNLKHMEYQIISKELIPIDKYDFSKNNVEEVKTKFKPIKEDEITVMI